MMIVEDQAWTRKGLLQLIDRDHLGIESIEETENGIEAYERIKQGGIQLLLTDIRMPGMDGLELSRLVREQFPEMKVVILSGHNEFEYAQKALRYQVRDYLLKPVQSTLLHQTLEKVIDELNDGKEREIHLYRMILRQLLEGNPLEDTDPIGIFSEAFGHSRKRIVRLRIEPFVRTEEYLRLAKQAFKPYGIHAIPLPAEDESIIFLSVEGTFADRTLKAIFTEISDKLQGCTIRVGLGQWFHNADHAWISDLESVLALQLCESNGFCEYRESLFVDASHETIGIQDLWTSLRQQDQIKMNHWLLQWFPENSPQAQTRFRCALLIKSMLQRLEDEIGDSLDYYSLIKRLKFIMKSTTHSEREMVQWVTETFRRAYDTMMNNETKQGKQIVGWCQAYIMNHLNDEIHLSHLAEKVHFSASHLSNLFKQFTGKNYIDFVTDLKINRALSYLEESNMKINEIASELGYSDSRYFSKLFRRIVGLTPSEYRNNLGIEKRR
ncbi:response regulator [Paenibacillus sp. MSJ-34]|uniref:response regulator n=1 Tax=Paenibacillus sp. MSJ-34 TaxID=2841529 RepID=UPI0020A0C5B6|nr:response regulator [Paenibacillus sp. MSJ-34]